MNSFSEKLSEYMKEKGISGKTVSDYIGLSTSGFSRLKRGDVKTLLTREQLTRLFELLKLTPKQSEQMRDLYDFRGFSVKERECIELVMRVLCTDYDSQSCDVVYEKVCFPSGKKQITGLQNVTNLICSAFDRVNAQDDGGCYLLSQMCNPNFTQLLRFLLKKYDKLSINHLFNFCSSSTDDYYIENISLFERIVPIIFTRVNYSVNLKYGEPYTFAKILPNILFFDKFMIALSDEMDKAEIYEGKNYERYKRSFIEEYNSCYNLFKSNNDALMSPDALRSESFERCYNSTSVLELYPCIKLFVDKNDLLEAFNGIEGIEYIWWLIGTMKKQYNYPNKKFCNYFSRAGLIDFCENGSYAEYYAAGRLINKPVLLRLIKKMIKIFEENDSYIPVMYDESKFRFNGNLSVECKDNGFTMFFINVEMTEYLRCLMVEPSIYLAGEIFLRYLRNSKYVFDVSEVVRILRYYERKIEDSSPQLQN